MKDCITYVSVIGSACADVCTYKDSMRRRILVLLVDGKTACVASCTYDMEDTRLINTELSLKKRSHTWSKHSKGGSASNRMERARLHVEAEFVRLVRDHCVRHLQGHDRLIIFGPAEAKYHVLGELQKTAKDFPAVAIKIAGPASKKQLCNLASVHVPQILIAESYVPPALGACARKSTGRKCTDEELQVYLDQIKQIYQEYGRFLPCDFCGSVASVSYCPCSAKKYCGRRCQKLDWHLHRFSCPCKLIPKET